MYRLVLATIGIWISLAAGIDNPIDQMGVKGPLLYDRQQFILTWSSRPIPIYTTQEYLPLGETRDTFHQMVSLHLIDTALSPLDAVQQKVNEIEERKKTDKVCNYQVNQNPDTKEYILDYLQSESDSTGMTILDFNIYRFRQIDLPKKRKAILVYAYTQRSYRAAIRPFLRIFNTERAAWLKEMATTTMPTIRISSRTER
jgi:hypothetical protein